MLTVQRNESMSDYMTGVLSNENGVICYTLEPGKERDPHPAIPAGTYPIEFRKEGGVYAWMSSDLTNRAGSDEQRAVAQQFIDNGVPHILVDGRGLIEIHIGNTSTDTEGCTLLGLTDNGQGSIGQSTQAYYKAYPIILQNTQIQYLDA